ncbi:hypothetical protein BJ912DRAFT_26711 [Pholiota molesta]|nr:hypothetical protein BJ912DRAFT_26711 [Pholiota molesta]
MAETTIEVYRIPTPASDTDVDKYSHLRLNALRTNPEAYGSTYADSVLLTHEQWRARVDTPGRTTLAARFTCAPADGHTPCGADEDAADWIGTLSVLHPLMLGDPDDLPRVARLAEAVEEGRVERYVLVGMWVHPSARRRGVGRALIRDAIELVREAGSDSEAPTAVDASGNGAAGKEGKMAKVVFLKVYAENEGAHGLYRQTGFVEETGYEGEVPGDIWMSFTL